jgi:hypothetical protein
MIKFLFPSICIMVITAAPCLAVNDSLYFLFQRSTYLENLGMPGAWWANPATLAEINDKIALTTNVTPLGNVFTITSARYVAPVANRFGWGIGILGAGINPNPDGSLQATNSSAQYQSHFSFYNPSIQIGFAAKVFNDWRAGFLFDFGAEQLPDGGGGQTNFSTIGIGLGVLTPYFFNRASFSLSTMSTGHFWLQPYWDYDGKAGLRFKSPDSLIMGSLEYTFSLVSGSIRYIYNSPANYYQVVKFLASIKTLSIGGILFGLSRDLGIFSDNGVLLHLGVELRRSAINPFFGGYEIGIATTQRNRDLFLHRLWLGYCFR